MLKNDMSGKFQRYCISLAFALSLAPTSISAQADSAPLVKVDQSKCDALLNSGGIFIFFDTACPICREYFPTIKSLAEEYGASYQFYFVCVPPSLENLNALQVDYPSTCTVLNDPAQTLQKALAATVTPQVFIVKNNRVLYSGRIDDRYVALSKRRTVVTHNELREALQALKSGERLLPKSNEAIGCFIEKSEAK